MSASLTPTFRLICEVVADRHGVSQERMLSRTRLQKYAWPRMSAMALCYREKGARINDVAAFFHRHRWCIGNAVGRMLEGYPSEVERFMADMAAVRAAREKKK